MQNTNASFFQETVQFLKPHPQRKNTFLLIEPHLLYLADSQADSYLDLMNNPKYTTSFHSDTVKVIQNNIQILFKSNTSPVTLIDLGPGYPDKSLPIAEYLKNIGVPLNYIPVDVSQRFLDVASHYIKPLARSVFPVRAKFEECAVAIPGSFYQSSTYCLIGLTFMNFPPSEFIPLLKKTAGPRGKVIVASELITSEKTVERILESYRNQEAETLTSGPLLNLGFEKDGLQYGVEFQESRVEMGFWLKGAIPKSLSSRGIKAGDRVVTAVSYRYTGDEIRKLLNQYFSQVQIFLSKDQGTCVALCE